MENRIVECRNLVRMLDGDVADSLGERDALAGSVAFLRPWSTCGAPRTC